MSKHGNAEIDLDLRANTRKLVLWDKPLSSTTGLLRTVVPSDSCFYCSVWAILRDRLGRVVSPEAVLIAGLRSLHLWLTAVPMAMAVERIACRFADELRPALHNI